MNKLLTFLVILLLVGGGAVVFMRVTSVNDTWIQDKETGEWMRRGNPTGSAPRVAITDCFTRAGRLYTQAVSLCVPALCGSDEVCINDLLDTLESLRGSADGVSLPPSAPPAGTIEATVPEDGMEGGVGGGEIDLPPSPPSDQDGAESSAASASPSVAENEMIRLALPLPNAALTSPFEVRGEVQEDVASVVVRVKGSNDAVLIQETITPRATVEGGWRPFKITLAYDFDSTKDGFIEVVPQGGDAVSVPVLFQ